MNRMLSNTLAAALVASSLLTSAATAEPSHDRPPPPPGHEFRAPPPPNAHWDRGREPPPYWGERNWEYRQGYLRRNRHDENDHDSSAGLIAGIVLGFVLGAAVVDSQQHQDNAQGRRRDRDWNDNCARRYRSFDPYSGTFLGTDGLRHYCR